MKETLYVARDIDNKLFVYGSKPKRGTKGKWMVINGTSCINISTDLFPELKFTDEPIEVKLVEA